jgi:hypothetical protein
MLFFIDGNFIEVVQENCYKGVFTFCSPSRKALLALGGSTMAEPVRLLGQGHKWALHIPENQTPKLISGVKTSSIESVDRITGPATAFAFDFVVESSLHTDCPAYGDYGYCWPEEIEATERWLYEREDPAADGVYFVPIWTTPDELTGAPRIDSSHDEEM